MVLQEYIFELKNELSELKALNRYLNKWPATLVFLQIRYYE